MASKFQTANIFAVVFILFLAVQATTLERRSTTSLNIQFDDTSVVEPVPDGYNHLLWTNWGVQTPDPNGVNKVVAPSPFQYGRIYAGTLGRIARGSGLGLEHFKISKFRFGCGVPVPADNFNSAAPKACKVTIRVTCLNGQTMATTANFASGQGALAMASKVLTQALPCQATGYTFKAVSNTGGPVDLLIDNISMTQKLQPA